MRTSRIDVGNVGNIDRICIFVCWLNIGIP